jgi:hypothetical protein
VNYIVWKHLPSYRRFNDWLNAAWLKEQPRLAFKATPFCDSSRTPCALGSDICAPQIQEGDCFFLNGEIIWVRDLFEVMPFDFSYDPEDPLGNYNRAIVDVLNDRNKEMMRLQGDHFVSPQRGELIELLTESQAFRLTHYPL